MNRKRRPLAPCSLLAMVALITACGSSATAGTGTSTASKQEQGVKFAQCMRKNGVPDFPDPDASGKLTIDAVANRSSVDPSTPAFEQAVSACKALEPAGFTGSKRSSHQQSAARRFAQCIRENGVPDFPDPLPNGPLVDTNRIPSSATSSGMSLLHAAMHRCGTQAAAAGVTR